MKVVISPLSTMTLSLPHGMLQRLEGMTTQQYYPILERIEYVYICSTPSFHLPPLISLLHLPTPFLYRDDVDGPQCSQPHESAKLPLAIKEKDVEYQVGLHSGCIIILYSQHQSFLAVSSRDHFLASAGELPILSRSHHL